MKMTKTLTTNQMKSIEKNRHQHRREFIELRDKKLIRLSRRLRELNLIERKAPLIQLDKPIQKGFRKDFVLREDITRRRDSHEITRILSAINQTVYCQKEDFKVKKWHSKQMEDIPHKLRHIPANQWDRLQWPPHYKKWFTFREGVIENKWGTLIIKGYWFNYPYMFVEKVSPHIVTHIKQHFPDIEREEAEIKRFFELHNGWARLDHLNGNSPYWKRWENTKDDQIEDLVREEMKQFEDNYLDPPAIDD